MEEQIVSFKTAKIANKNGFGFIQSYGQGSSLYNKNGKHTYYMNYGFMYSGLYEGYISAPTQGFLSKWLREKHNILVVPIYGYHDNPHYSVHIENIKLMENDEDSVLMSGIHFKPTLFNTYEEAMETGLQIALKNLMF